LPASPPFHAYALPINRGKANTSKTLVFFETTSLLDARAFHLSINAAVPSGAAGPLKSWNLHIRWGFSGRLKPVFPF